MSFSELLYGAVSQDTAYHHFGSWPSCNRNRLQGPALPRPQDPP
jgi:hypothetical protein